MEVRNKMVSILIPVFNTVEELDATLQSIYLQSYDRKNIYITAVDFGSTDGSYEKLFTYPSYHLAVYQYDGDFTEETMIAQASNFLKYTDLKEETYSMVLMPGDIIYPSYLEKVTEAILRYRKLNPTCSGIVVNEVDIRLESGKVIYRNPLLKKESLLETSKNCKEYSQKEYKRNVICFNLNLSERKNRWFGARNEGIWWNKVVLHNNHENIIYLQERLACIKERFYEDELKEILLRWEAIIYFNRVEEGKEKIIQENAEKELAMYALWRSFIMKKRQKHKQARECFLISSVIYSKIKENELYSKLQGYVMEDKIKFMKQIGEEF